MTDSSVPGLVYYESGIVSSVDDGVSSSDRRSVDVPSLRSGELLKASGFPDELGSDVFPCQLTSLLPFVPL